MAYEFHYTPTGTGVISGKEVLEQTEDAINDLSGQISGDVQIAIDTANNALNTANTASADAQNAINTANTAYTAATNAQNTANTAQNTASNALTAAQNAQNDVNALGNRVTTAENNISQNTSDISGLTTRMGTAEGNIGNLQTAVSNAQATANSAQQTAATARQQAYVFRYSSTALTASSTNSNALLDNTDNLKVGDKVIDSSGVLFSVTAIDTANSTFTIGTALIDLALDANVVHTSGNETVSGEKTFTSSIKGYNSDSTQSTVSIDLRTSKVSRGNTSDGVDTFGFGFRDKNNIALASISCVKRSTGETSESHTVNTTDSSNNVLSESYSFNLSKDGTSTFRPETNDKTLLGTSTKRWKDVQTNLINGLTPSSLGMPDLDNGIDISSYITTGSIDNTYTPPVNGWIWIKLIGSTNSGASIIQGDWGINARTITSNITNDRLIETNLAVSKGIPVIIRCVLVTDVVSAKFYPCLGNV